MELEDEGRSGEESESESEYEEYTDSEDEMEPRLKPVFIRKWVMRPCGAALGEDTGVGSWGPSRHRCRGLLLPLWGRGSPRRGGARADPCTDSPASAAAVAADQTVGRSRSGV